VLILVGLWFVSAFVLFSAMITKFHHYVFPVVPAAAILVGLLVDQMMGPKPESTTPQARLARLSAYVSPAVLALGVGALRGNLRGLIPAGFPRAQYEQWSAELAWAFLTRHEIPSWVPRDLRAGWGAAVVTQAAIGLSVTVVGLALAIWGARAMRVKHDPDTARAQLWTSAAALGAPLVVAFVGRDLS
jgi:4-amino-4-deoxy-L-arabinose transferase-like glycosyltransferase